MAIRTPSADYSPLSNAIQRNTRAESSQYVDEQYGIQSRMRAISQDKIDLNRKKSNQDFAVSMVNAGIEAVKLSKQAYDQYKAIKQEEQLSQAKTDMLNMQTTYGEMLAESQINNRTKAVQGENGEVDIQVDPNILSWEQEQIQAIDNSDDFDEVKAWKKQAVLEIFNTGKRGLIQSTAETALKTIQTNFDVQLDKSLSMDIQGETYDNGSSLISSRNDLSPMQKENMLYTYRKQVDLGVVKQRASNIAATQGSAAATEAIWALDGYTPEQKQSIINEAIRTDNMLTDSAIDSATQLMSSGLESGKSLAELWSQVRSSVENMPASRREAVLDAVRSIQVEHATNTGLNLYSQDKTVSVAKLRERRNSIASGDLYNTTFFNTPQVRKNLLDMYDGLIASKESAASSSTAQQQKFEIDQNKSMGNIIYQQYVTGEYTAEEAVSKMRDIGQGTVSLDDDEFIAQTIAKIYTDETESGKDAANDNATQINYQADVVFNKFRTGQLDADEAVSELNALSNADNNTAKDESYISGKIAQISEDSESSAEDRKKNTSSNLQSVAELEYNNFVLGSYDLEQTTSKLLELAENATSTDDIVFIQGLVVKATEKAVEDNQHFADTVYNTFTAGKISAREAVSSLAKTGQNTPSMQDDSYVEEMITKISDNIVPKRFKTYVDDFMERMDTQAWGLQVSRTNTGKIDESKLTQETIEQMNDSKTWAHAAIVDLLMDSAAGDMSISDFNASLNNISRVFTAKNLDAITSVKITEGWRKDPAEDMVNINYQMGSTKPVFYDDETQDYQWVNDGVKETFDNVAGQFRNELEDKGVSVMGTATPLYLNGEAYPYPQYMGKDNKTGQTVLYTIDRDDIFESKDNGKTWTVKWSLGKDNKKIDTSDLDYTNLNQFFNRFR